LKKVKAAEDLYMPKVRNDGRSTCARNTEGRTGEKQGGANGPSVLIRG